MKEEKEKNPLLPLWNSRVLSSRKKGQMHKLIDIIHMEKTHN